MNFSRSVRRMAMGLGVATVLLGAVELGLRLTLGPPPPPVRVYTVVSPGMHAFHEENGQVLPNYVTVDPPPPIAATPTGPRWIAIGASSVHGGTIGITRDQEFPALAGKSAGVEILNLATPGLDSFDLASLTEQLDVLHPTGIIVYEGHNDVGNAWFQKRFATTEAVLTARLDSLLSGLRLFTELRRGLSPVEGRGRHNGDQGDLGGFLTPERRARAEAYFSVNYRRIAWRCAHEGWRLMLITPVSNILAEPGGMAANQVAHDHWAAGKARIGSDPEGAVRELRAGRDADVVGIRASTHIQEEVRKIAAETGAILVDADHDLPREPGVDTPAATLFSDPLHLSAQGHVELAELVAKALPR